MPGDTPMPSPNIDSWLRDQGMAYARCVACPVSDRVIGVTLDINRGCPASVRQRGQSRVRVIRKALETPFRRLKHAQLRKEFRTISLELLGPEFCDSRTLGLHTIPIGLFLQLDEPRFMMPFAFIACV